MSLKDRIVTIERIVQLTDCQGPDYVKSSLPIGGGVATVKINDGERFMIARRRSGLRQTEIPGLGQRAVSAVERGFRAVPQGITWPEGISEWRTVWPEPWEEAVILRKRAGLTIEEAAALFGVSRQWAIELEKGRGDCWAYRWYLAGYLDAKRKRRPKTP